jgi:hypothetical protein
MTTWKTSNHSHGIVLWFLTVLMSQLDSQTPGVNKDEFRLVTHHQLPAPRVWLHHDLCPTLQQSDCWGIREGVQTAQSCEWALCLSDSPAESALLAGLWWAPHTPWSQIHLQNSQLCCTPNINRQQTGCIWHNCPQHQNILKELSQSLLVTEFSLTLNQWCGFSVAITVT